MAGWLWSICVILPLPNVNPQIAVLHSNSCPAWLFRRARYIVFLFLINKIIVRIEADLIQILCCHVILACLTQLHDQIQTSLQRKCNMVSPLSVTTLFSFVLLGFFFFYFVSGTQFVTFTSSGVIFIILCWHVENLVPNLHCNSIGAAYLLCTMN